MPKLWNETVEAHRREVRDAILEATAGLVSEHGLRTVTMAQVAQKAGIGRATLYKYFPDLDSILHAWHADQISRHLHQLTEARDQAGDPGRRLETVLKAYAEISRQTRGHHDTELVTFLHRDDQVASAQRQLHDLFRHLLTEAADAGDIRTDVTPDELATYCLHALNAAYRLPSQAAVRRLVNVTLTGLRPRVRDETQRG